MTAYALVTSTLFRSPEQRTSKNGNPFVTATIRREGWRCRAILEGCRLLGKRAIRTDAPREGDAVSVQGPLKVETYERDGELKVSLSIIANNVLALHQPREPTRKAYDAELNDGGTVW